MPETYRDEVINYYQLQLSRGSLSPNLVDPTPGSIRDECLLVFAKKRNLRDMKILQMFVGNRDDVEDYERALRKVDVGKFKPLQKFIYKPKTRTSNRNVELLAWLIDFKQDVFKPIFPLSDDGIKPEETVLDKIEKTQELSEKEADSTRGGRVIQSKTSGDNDDKGTKKNDDKTTRKYKGSIIALSVAIAIAIGNFIFHQYNPECMYWNGYKYIAADCSQTIPTSDVIALDESALQNLRWITRADTISAKHINKIWYIRNDNMVELFTSGGQYPLDRKRRLFLLSKTIYNNYVATKKVRVE